MRPFLVAALLVALLSVVVPGARAEEDDGPPVPRKPPAMPTGPDAFRGEVERPDLIDYVKTLRRAIDEGTAGEGRGFVLMPSASPYGRTITPTTMRNYETMVRVVTGGVG